MGIYLCIARVDVCLRSCCLSAILPCFLGSLLCLFFCFGLSFVVHRCADIYVYILQIYKKYVSIYLSKHATSNHFNFIRTAEAPLLPIGQAGGGGGFGQAGGATATINSVSHPAAYAWLARNCKEGKGLPDDVLRDWDAGGAKRNKLLANFVRKVYVPGATNSTNCLRLEAFSKIRQATKDFSTALQGYEWKTEAEMGSGEGGLKWSENLAAI